MSKKANPIIQSWAANAKKWIKTIEKDEIASRRLVTNAAILSAILENQPQKVLDIGCGEGWLVHTLTKHKIKAVGVDAIPAFIKKAKSKEQGQFEVQTYEAITKGVKFKIAPFDLISINFSLFENKKTARLIKKLPAYLEKKGTIVIQTLHPHSIATKQAYQSAWRKDSWAGLQRNFTKPYKWYFRTLEDWIKLFSKANLQLVDLKEPIHPITKRPTSIIFVVSLD